MQQIQAESQVIESLNNSIARLEELQETNYTYARENEIQRLQRKKEQVEQQEAADILNSMRDSYSDAD